jgi:hypothetical protein
MSVPSCTLSAPSCTLDVSDVRQEASRARFMWLVEALRRETNTEPINRGDRAHAVRVSHEYQASNKLLHLLHEYGVRSEPALIQGNGHW